MKKAMNMHNARHKDQLERMHRLENEGKCFFCGDNYTRIGAAPAIFESKSWYIKKNDYPYKGSVHHYLIVPRKHIQSLREVRGRMQSELFRAAGWLEKKTGVKGFSIFARSDDIYYTGATIDHLHFHFVSGARKVGPSKLNDYILAPLGYKKK